MKQASNECQSKMVFERKSTTAGLCWVVYHAQEHCLGQQVLSQPMLCERLDAWLGVGYYFWVERSFAEWWGRSRKCNSQFGYDLFAAWLLLDEEWVLNTTFSEKDYSIWRTAIEVAIQHLQPQGLQRGEEERLKLKPVQLVDVMKLVQKMLKKYGYRAIVYDDIDVKSSPINFKADNPNKPSTKSHVFSYLKRIQLVVFDLEGILHKFERLEENTRA